MKRSSLRVLKSWRSIGLREARVPIVAVFCGLAIHNLFLLFFFLFRGQEGACSFLLSLSSFFFWFCSNE